MVSAPTSRLGPAELPDVLGRLRATAALIGKGLFIETRTLPDKARPLGRFPHVKRVGNLAFVSGTSARRPDNSFAGVTLRPGEPPSIDVETQTRETLVHISDILHSVGSNLENVLQVEAYLTRIGEIAGFEAACDAIFGNARPTIQTVAATALPHPYQAVMIKAVATIAPTPQPRRQRR